MLEEVLEGLEELEEDVVLIGQLGEEEQQQQEEAHPAELAVLAVSLAWCRSSLYRFPCTEILTAVQRNGETPRRRGS